MSNPSKAKGTRAETAVVDLAAAHNIPALRPALSGSTDKGDVWLWPRTGGARVVIEVKDRPSKYARFPSWVLLQQWMEEAHLEGVYANADVSILVVKPIGVGHGRAGDWWAWVQPSDLVCWANRLPDDWVEPVEFVPCMYPLGSLLAWLGELA